eukprot:c15871_g1_i1.p1 GENE.c15871_g1_i1~~c15871_g1_i1.p1  ORF type:complete len:305 (+),score=50.03 c15871_g1_i1:1-915(+)
MGFTDNGQLRSTCPTHQKTTNTTHKQNKNQKAMILWVAVFCLCGSSICLLGVLWFLADLHWKNSLFPSQISSRMITHSSCWLISPGTLLSLRLCYFLFSFGILVYSYVLHFPTLLAFFTLWNYHIQTLYFALVTWFTIRSSREGGNLEMDAGTLGRVIFVLNQLNTSMVALVAVILWAVILPDKISKGEQSTVLNFESYSQHAFNVPCVFAEFLLNGMHTQSPQHLLFILLWGALYAEFCVIFQFFGGFSPYFFSDVNSRSTPIWTVGVLAIMVLFYGVPIGLEKAKARYQSRPLDSALLSDHS